MALLSSKIEEGKVRHLKDVNENKNNKHANTSISTIRIPPNVMEKILENNKEGHKLFIDGSTLRSSTDSWDLQRAEERIQNIDIINADLCRVGTLKERITLKPSILTISSTKEAIRKLDREEEVTKENRRIIPIEVMITPTKTKPSSKIGSATKNKNIPSVTTTTTTSVRNVGTNPTKVHSRTRVQFLNERIKVLNEEIDERLQIFKDIEKRIDSGIDVKKSLFVLNVEEGRLKVDAGFHEKKKELSLLINELHGINDAA